MKILAFCFFPAFVPPENGGQSRLFNFYLELSRWHHVTLLTSTHPNVDEERVEHGLNFIERRIPKDAHFVRHWVELLPYSSGGDLSGPVIAACAHSPTLLHQAYLQEYEKADVLFFDFPFTAQYDLFAGLDDKPRIYNAHNCETVLYRQLHPEAKSDPIVDVVRNSERCMLKNVDLVLYCNDGDLDHFREMAPDTALDTMSAPNGMTPVAPTTDDIGDVDNSLRVVFMGSGHPPNVKAVELIVSTLAPAFPKICFDIIGSCLSEGDYPPNIMRHGVVDDATKMLLLRQADIAINPMTSGSGSNVKVLEYFAHGIPVISTKFGMRGIEALAGTHFVESALDEIGLALQQAMVGMATLKSIGQAAKAFALERYTWEAVVRPVAERVQELVRFKKRYESKASFVLALNDYDSFDGIGGGGTRTRGLYESAKAWSPVVFICFSDDGSIGTRTHSDFITVIHVPKTEAHLAELQLINNQFHISANDIIASRHCKANHWLSAVYKVLRRSARCIVSEHCYMVALPISFGDRFVYSSQNNETDLKTRQLEWHPAKNELLVDVEQIERMAVERSAAIIAVSDEDAESLVIGKRTAGPVIVVRNGAAVPASGEDVTRIRHELESRIGPRSVVFLGSAHMPNVDAAQFIVTHLVRQCPDVEFHLVGSVCGAIQDNSRNVHCWGVVDDATKSAIMQACAIALNPMISGSGSNVKLADYIGNGLYVITTEFGQRGYPSSIQEHLAVVPLNDFAESIQMTLADPSLITENARARRAALFLRELDMRVLAQRFVETLQKLEQVKKRVLFVTYRYTSPTLGGAEANIEKFIRALGNDGAFDVDVIAPEVSGIHSNQRFSETYTFDAAFGVPIDIPNVRFARFPLNDVLDKEKIDVQVRKAWSIQPGFERLVSAGLQEHYRGSGLTWGWCYPDSQGSGRWACIEFGIFLDKPARVDLRAYTNDPAAIMVYSEGNLIYPHTSVQDNFSMSFHAEAGAVRFVVSKPTLAADLRPLGVWVSHLTLNGIPFDLSGSTYLQKYLGSLRAEQSFRLLDHAAQATRLEQDVQLTPSRGPWSDSLERFIEDHVADYDLLVTHNNIFRPAVIALEAAKRKGVLSILIPHAHLDDDFYHFQDFLDSARNANLVLAVPNAACDFFAEKGCNVRYMPAGCDLEESFTVADQDAFRQIYLSSRPFILVLGRKAGAKGYREIIEVVDAINQAGRDLLVILIGPDDDSVQIDSSNAVYLGRQSRSVVRGALMSSVALCSMSRSESFGIVLLEAWLAGKPVIANIDCAAFHDMAVNDENALLVSIDNLHQAITRLIDNPSLARQLANAGQLVAERFGWDKVNSDFIAIVKELMEAD